MQESRLAGRHIQAEYERIGLTQTALAERLGTTQPNVSAWVNGSREPNREHLAAMSRLFGCSVDYLMGLTTKRGELRAAARRGADDEMVERLRLIRQLASGVALSEIRAKLAGGVEPPASGATAGPSGGLPNDALDDLRAVEEQIARAPRRKRRGET
jgi:transcriptional regulator with XRE-family HTH domain